MALVTEDGTGLATAESYISVADADTYIAAYKGANATWDGATEAAKEIAARQATQYLDGLYIWKGVKAYTVQALGWPRNYAYDETGTAYTLVPTKLEQATAEVMFLIITGVSLTATVTQASQTKSKRVEGAVSVEYFDSVTYQPVFPVITRLLSDLAAMGGRTVRA